MRNYYLFALALLLGTHTLYAQAPQRPGHPQTPNIPTARPALFVRNASWDTQANAWRPDSTHTNLPAHTPSSTIIQTTTDYQSGADTRNVITRTDAANNDTSYATYVVVNGVNTLSSKQASAYDASNKLTRQESYYYDPFNGGTLQGGNLYTAAYGSNGQIVTSAQFDYQNGSWVPRTTFSYGFATTPGIPDTATLYMVQGSGPATPYYRGLHYPLASANNQDTLLIEETYSGGWNPITRTRTAFNPTSRQQVVENYVSGTGYVYSDAWSNYYPDDTTSYQYYRHYDAVAAHWDSVNYQHNTYDTAGRAKLYESFNRDSSGIRWARANASFSNNVYVGADLVRIISYYVATGASTVWIPSGKADYVYPLVATQAKVATGLRTWPNPTTGVAYVEVPAGTTYGLLYNSAGRSVGLVPVANGRGMADLSNQPKGAYQVRFSGGKQAAVVTLVKE